MKVKDILIFLYKQIINSLFPEKCIKCSKKDILFCDKCISETKKAQRETREGIMSVFDYRDPYIRKAIWDLKYYNKKNLGSIFGDILYETFLEEISDLRLYSLGEKIIVIPVPISKKRNKGRGYNQSLAIAKSFVQKENIFELKNNLIFKNRETIPQARLKNKKDRLSNIKGAFDIKDRNFIKNKTFIIIDDVTTTGGTITEIIKILKKNKAKKVLGLTIAH
ncbi:TPA: ComF family protein [Candidatus Nomurabacteria bacterium]|nr:MAG: hypothetical protein O210_OD1C00001G0473 [Parcubacteria bacterium RAAC4_OD1_1]HCY26301.1 ComF family protein [Candidatus Nomurabacteria bacterium]